MKKITFKHHPNDYFAAFKNSDERAVDEKTLLEAYSSTDGDEIRISVFSDTGSKSPTVYKCTRKESIEIPQKLEDFEFKIVGI